jgi:DNA-binding XRE family transcriptional regulator
MGNFTHDVVPSFRGSKMKKREFSIIRNRLGKTQVQMSQLLGVSLKAVQSFEQGWRNVPVHTERQTLLLLALKETGIKKNRPCWSIKNCSEEARQACPAWEFNAGQICWHINGTICAGKPQKTWVQKMKQCRKCEVFEAIFPADALKAR